MDAPRPGRLARVSGAVLVGGASQRMGRDKTHLELGGVPLAVGAAALLADFLEDVVLVGGDPPADAPGRRVPDPDGPRCALRGLVGALQASRGERVVVLATDLPLLTPDLVLGLIAQPPADAVVPRNADGSHPLCAVYRREPVLAAARAHLVQDRLALRPLLETVETRFVEGDALRALDPDGKALLNVNDESDLARARERAAALR